MQSSLEEGSRGRRVEVWHLQKPPDGKIWRENVQIAPQTYQV